MNPWWILLNSIGWLFLALHCLFVIVLAIATIATTVQTLQRKKGRHKETRTTEIISSRKQ